MPVGKRPIFLEVKHKDEHEINGLAGDSTTKDLKLSSVKATGLVLGFIMQLVFTRVIGVREYGLYVLFLTWTNFFSILLFLGYDRLIIKELSYLYLQKKQNTFKATLDKLMHMVALNSVIFLLFAFLVPHQVLTSSFFSKEISRTTWLLVATGTVLSTAFTLFGKVQIATQRAELSSIRSEIVYKVICFCTVLLLYFNVRSIVGDNIIIAGVVVAYFFSLLLYVFIIDWKKIKQYLAIKKENIIISRENYTFFFTSLNYYIVLQLDKIILSKYVSLETLGVYGLVSTLVILISFSTVVYNRFLPKISNYIFLGRISELEKEFKITTRNSLLIALPFIMFLIIFTEDILLFFGKEFTSGTPILRVLIWGQLLQFLTGPNGSLLVIGKFAKVDLINSILFVVLAIVLNFIGFRYYGVLGVAAASSLSLALINLIKVIEVKYYYNIFPYELENLVLIVLAFMAFYAVSLLPITIDNLLLRLLTKFTLSFALAAIPIAFFFFLKYGDKPRLKGLLG
ncbi:oligosaccharide flippase family protein [Pontibacter kalidii]|uniref:oligosaccharide flippase family protein n=1 Tax=Pontibacter kalidii TaxID=2592049 RepID=UPI002259F794|nr:oligosaccharide flippase family protein [Pontibacter kalidii]